jgi:hypothetical protein
MDGVWFAAMIAFLVVAGVVMQLGWQLPEISAVKKAVQRGRSPADQDVAPSTNS